MRSNRSPVGLVLMLIVAVTMMLLAAIAPSFVVGTLYFLRFWWLWIFFIIGVIMMFGVFMGDGTGWAMAGIGLLIAGVTFFAAVKGQAYNRRVELVSTLQVVTETGAEPGYEIRPVHYDVASAILTQKLGDMQGVTAKNVTFIGDVEQVRWTVIADGGGFGKPLKGVVAYYADGTVERCEMNGPAISGLLGNRLSNAIRREKFFVNYKQSDIYGDCVNGEGRIFVPLIKYRGFANVPYPAGLAIMDKYGNVTVYDTILPEDVVGPVYPESIAKSQEDALDVGGGFGRWFWGSFGYEETGDTFDPNTENSGQYNLRQFGTQDHYFVTPLTAKGSGQSLVGRVEIRADVVTFGQHNTGIFLKYSEPLNGTSTMGEQIQNRYSNEMNWVLVKLQEVVPGPGTTHVAYIGQKKTLNYIATYHRNGEITKVTVTPEGGPAEAVQPTDVVSQPAFTVTGSEQFDLSGMSTEDLINLDIAIQQEIYRRLQEE